MKNRNAEGYRDPTAHAAIITADDTLRFKNLIKTIFCLCDKAGFRIEGRIVLVDKKSGKVWR